LWFFHVGLGSLERPPFGHVAGRDSPFLVVVWFLVIKRSARATPRFFGRTFVAVLVAIEIWPFFIGKIETFVALVAFVAGVFS
jgi:hypothetical protein